MDHEDAVLFRAEKFPDASGLLLGRVVTKCWTVEYRRVGDLQGDIERIRELLETTYSTGNNSQYKQATLGTKVSNITECLL